MYNTIPEILRKEAVNNIFGTNTMQVCWKTWKGIIQGILGANFTENDIINLGDHLSDIFNSTNNGSRTQGDVSSGGTAWESLVCWYINLCSIGSRTVALRRMSIVPKPIQDSITVNYGNFSCNTESDITIIVFPDLPSYKNDITATTLASDNKPILKNDKIRQIVKDELAARDFSQYEIGIVQCKTNWNDNAQIPMLWDMIYAADKFKRSNLTVGKNNFSIRNTRLFTYAFVTVPSNAISQYKSDCVAVKRITNLSGGNYWGRPSKQNIAKSIKEIFANNYQSGQRIDLRTDLKAALPDLNRNGSLSYFNLTN